MKTIEQEFVNSTDPQIEEQISIVLSTFAKIGEKATPHFQSQLSSFYQTLALNNLQRMKEMGKSSAPRETPYRTPMDVLTNFMAEVWEIREKTKDNPPAVLTNVIETIQTAILSHDLTAKSVKELLEASKEHLSEYQSLTSLCDNLIKDLPSEEGYQYPQAQLQDSIYSRALESFFVNHLVASPPDSVRDVMHMCGQELAQHLQQNLTAEQQNSFASEFKQILKKTDPRFWFPKGKVDGIMNAKTDQEAFQEIIKFLKAEVVNGIDAIARPYFIVNISLLLRELIDDTIISNGTNEKQALELRQQFTAPWLIEADANYRAHLNLKKGLQRSKFSQIQIQPQPSRPIAGITLASQPEIISEDWMKALPRPVDKNRTLDYSDPKSTQNGIDPTPLQQSLTHGIAHIAGVSGSANIILHFFQFLKTKGITNPDDIKPLLLGCAMFLCYDGGHSIHEVLYIANQLNTSLGLGVDFSSSISGSTPETFISDYRKLINQFPEAKTAMDQAFHDLVGYFHENSYFSSKNSDA